MEWSYPCLSASGWILHSETLPETGLATALPKLNQAAKPIASYDDQVKLRISASNVEGVPSLLVLWNMVLAVDLE